MRKGSTRRILAENLRIIRLIRQLSQEKLAALSGLNRSYIGEIERAQRNLSLDNLEKLSRALDTSIAELLKEPDRQELAHQLIDSVRKAVDTPRKQKWVNQRALRADSPL